MCPDGSLAWALHLAPASVATEFGGDAMVSVEMAGRLGSVAIAVHVVDLQAVRVGRGGSDLRGVPGHADRDADRGLSHVRIRRPRRAGAIGQAVQADARVR